MKQIIITITFISMCFGGNNIANLLQSHILFDDVYPQDEGNIDLLKVKKFLIFPIPPAQTEHPGKKYRPSMVRQLMKLPYLFQTPILYTQPPTGTVYLNLQMRGIHGAPRHL